MSPDAPQLHAEVPQNTFLRVTGGRQDATVFARASVIVGADFRTDGTRLRHRPENTRRMGRPRP
ncbi:MAG: hypothetical protein ACE5FK_05405, partial [Candidatus Methylomirabilia bacterium]